MGSSKLLDPICDMVVSIAEARDQGLTLELPDREYAFCSHGCLVKFSGSPEAYRAKVDAWVAAGGAPGHGSAHAHGDALPVIDNGIREWYKSCRCCLSDSYPAVVEQLDAERKAMAAAPAEAGSCEVAEGQPPA